MRLCLQLGAEVLVNATQCSVWIVCCAGLCVFVCFLVLAAAGAFCTVVLLCRAARTEEVDGWSCSLIEDSVCGGHRSTKTSCLQACNCRVQQALIVFLASSAHCLIHSTAP